MKYIVLASLSDVDSTPEFVRAAKLLRAKTDSITSKCSFCGKEVITTVQNWQQMTVKYPRVPISCVSCVASKEGKTEEQVLFEQVSETHVPEQSYRTLMDALTEAGRTPDEVHKLICRMELTGQMTVEVPPEYLVPHCYWLLVGLNLILNKGGEPFPEGEEFAHIVKASLNVQPSGRAEDHMEIMPEILQFLKAAQAKINQAREKRND